jgi:hypothetical protein
MYANSNFAYTYISRSQSIVENGWDSKPPLPDKNLFPMAPDSVVTGDYLQTGTHSTFNALNSSDFEQQVVLPFQYYPSYVSNLHLSETDDGLLAVTLPAHWQGEVTTRFQNSTGTLVGLGIAVLTLLGLVGYAVYYRRKG